VAKHIDTFKSWSDTIVADVAALKALIESTPNPRRDAWPPVPSATW
jgi:hypothetical protein